MSNREIAPGERRLEDLMVGYQSGEADSASILIERLSPELFRFFMAQEATRNEAHDLMQETFLRIHRVRRTYRTGAPLLPWVFAIARRVRVDGYRKRSRINRMERVGDELPEVVTPEDRGRNAIPDMRRMMQQLPEGQREVVTLLKVNGLSLDEVSRATGLTVGAVKQKASRAYGTLRAFLLAEGFKA